ncbi:NUDIX hydrolase [Candidatus Peribacteria bacterium]|nr:NUDIX hydrolase [Candidatus Peribacteria bacterium]
MTHITATPRVTVRGLIIDQGEILGFQHRPTADYYALPGGGVDYLETLEEAMVREMEEETGITPVVGGLRFVHQLCIDDSRGQCHLLEFFYLIENGAAYRAIDWAAASHAYEVHDAQWISLQNPQHRLLPSFVIPSLRQSLTSHGPEMHVSRT